MTTYTWQFVKLDVFPTYNGLTDVVESATWRLTADDGLGHLATAYGEQAVGPPDPQNFTPFANLTFNQVQGWVEAAMGSELAVLQAALDQQIADQVTPEIVQMAPPW